MRASWMMGRKIVLQDLKLLIQARPVVVLTETNVTRRGEK